MSAKTEAVLFPDKGVQTALGKVYQPYGFGSTRPRNMMPGHLLAEDDPKATGNISTQQSHAAKIGELRAKVAKKKAEIAEMSRTFQQRDNSHKSTKRLGLFRAGVTLLEDAEKGRRQVDKSGFLKTYSASDKQLWKEGETRHWYNKYAAHEVEDGVPNVWQYAGATDRTLFATNTVPQSESPSRGLHRPHSVAEFSRSTTSFSSTYSPHADPDFAAGRRPGLTISRSRHWLDMEGVLSEQRARESAGRVSITLTQPWLDRPVQESGPQLTREAVQAREKALYDRSQYVASQEHLKSVTTVMRAHEKLY